MTNSYTETSYRWYVLFLVALTSMSAVAVPIICISVLFKEIAGDLGLSLVQVGFIWGIASLPSIFIGLVAGSRGDRFGPKRILIVGCLLVGLAGALRGLANAVKTLTLKHLKSSRMGVVVRGLAHNLEFVHGIIQDKIHEMFVTPILSSDGIPFLLKRITGI